MHDIHVFCSYFTDNLKCQLKRSTSIKKGINTDANMLGEYQKQKAKASNWWSQKPLKKSQDSCDTSVFNIIDNLMATGGRICINRVGVGSQLIKICFVHHEQDRNF